MSDVADRARAFLSGTHLTLKEADDLWRALKRADELSLARRVLERLRGGNGLLGSLPSDPATRNELCQQEALLTSKDPELGAAMRHDRALQILGERFNLDSPGLDGDAETLGIAGGIVKRRWNDLGQIEDLRKAAKFYGRGAGQDLGDDAYAHVNSAFMEDLLAQIGDDRVTRLQRAKDLRERIVKELPASATWWNAATRAEALFGLGRYAEARDVVAQNTERPAPWQLETTVRQLATIADMYAEHPLKVPEIRAFFDALLPEASQAALSTAAYKVGLALSGGGFRASLYHLGVLARLAELDVLRHVDVLSCVSGGGIVGVCYWLALRKRLLQPTPLGSEDYVAVVKELIGLFLEAVGTDLCRAGQPSKIGSLCRILSGSKGALDPEAAADAIEQRFYQPLWGKSVPIYMHDLPFKPADHDPALTGSQEFHPGRHNWLRAHKVPILVLNATTVNTSHAWQFTPTWMGESPWAVHEAADSIPRLEWSWYEPTMGWQMELGRAVAASACVPGVFAPLEINGAYEGVKVQLVDGGIHDNQGTASLLALNCNVLLVSDACGQLMLEKQTTPGVTSSVSYAYRVMLTLMERVRQTSHRDLAARRQTGLLRGLMFLHMKAGLDADPIRLRFAQESYTLHREQRSPSGVRKDFQQALAELRTDLDAFTREESLALMACGYKMASWAFQRDLAHLPALRAEPTPTQWPFVDMLTDITSTTLTKEQDALLERLRRGSRMRIFFR